ncbi:hypothetical protein PAMP_023225 [Pampus punctatissimus]
MRSLLDGPKSYNVYFPPTFLKESGFERSLLAVAPPELIQNPVDLSQRKSSTISGVQSLLPRVRSETPSLTAATTVPDVLPLHQAPVILRRSLASCCWAAGCDWTKMRASLHKTY